ncbi:hypothetical protein [Kribbella sp. NPDC003557]|uniref:hypothetical protein n=1 Tax=Kribbella sp. NPDC003557 TaxID=3154449 RepID=UPI0033B6203A
MAIESLQELAGRQDSDSVKEATRQALWELYYGDRRSSPDSVDTFKDELRRELENSSQLDESERDETISALAAQADSEYGGSATNLAVAFLTLCGWVTDEDAALLGARELYRELWWDENTKRYYDEAGQWYDADQQPLPPDAAQEPAAASTAGSGPVADEPIDAESARQQVWNEIPALATQLGVTEEVLRAEFSKLTLDEVDSALHGDLTPSE